ncbi:hypothetical protein FBU30_009502 [Linnemannia zychae]|nr:hypothetical protein FBU30_009502 [Linnemannia zychae]
MYLHIATSILLYCIAIASLHISSATPISVSLHVGSTTPAYDPVDKSIKETCKSFHLKEGSMSVVQAICNTECDEQVATEIDLSPILGNINGHFQFGDQHFEQSGRSFRIEGTVLYGILRDMDDMEIESSIDLSQEIVNRDGKLTYVS